MNEFHLSLIGIQQLLPLILNHMITALISLIPSIVLRNLVVRLWFQSQSCMQSINLKVLDVPSARNQYQNCMHPCGLDSLSLFLDQIFPKTMFFQIFLIPLCTLRSEFCVDEGFQNCVPDIKSSSCFYIIFLGENF